jgi:hypothetical protein
MQSKPVMLQAIRNVDSVLLLSQGLGPMRSFYHDTPGFLIYREREGWVELRRRRRTRR